jgi:hypothetical protein
MQYAIRVKGHLDLCWADRLGGIEITHEADGTSTLSGAFPDQAAVIAALTRLNSLSIHFLSVTARPDRPAAGQTLDTRGEQ